MAYLDSRDRPSAGSMAAVVAIHGAVGAALIFGLTVTGVIQDREIVAGFQVKRPVPPPPPPDPQPDARASDTPDRKIVVPPAPFPQPTATSTIDTTTEIWPPQPPFRPGNGDDIAKVIPSPTPSFAAIAARPRTDPSRWVSTEDYRSNWIRQEMTGKARFRLEIAADGRVTDCTITGSSGHPELDAATCALVRKRARFQPARGSDGEAVAGNYTNAIDWQLPE